MIEFRPIGWEPMQAEWWPAVAAKLPRPWPREAVLFDLRWWRGQERATGRKLMPGRPALQQRWGWVEWDARKIMRSESEWMDNDKLSSGPPVVLQPLSSGPPAAEPVNAGNSEESSSGPPAVLQPLSSNPPRARSLYTDHRSPITEGEGERATPTPPQQPEPEAPQSPAVPVVAPQTIADPAVPAPTQPAAARAAQEPFQTQAVHAVWGAWRARCRPRASLTPHPRMAETIGEALQAASIDQLVLLIEWWADDTDPKADPTYWRQRDPNHGLDLALQGQRLEGRLTASQAWHDRGRVAPRAPPSALPPPKKQSVDHDFLMNLEGDNGKRSSNPGRAGHSGQQLLPQGGVGRKVAG